MNLEVGTLIPKFETVDESDNFISSEDLLGSASVIYFYPKDDTPGCTKEACSFRDNMDALDTKGVIVLGISPDDAMTHRRFADKYSLNFSLIPDSTKELAKLFGVVKKNQEGIDSIERTTFIVDERGVIRWIERPAQVEGHVERVLNALDTLNLG